MTPPCLAKTASFACSYTLERAVEQRRQVGSRFEEMGIADGGGGGRGICKTTSYDDTITPLGGMNQNCVLWERFGIFVMIMVISVDHGD